MLLLLLHTNRKKNVSNYTPWFPLVLAVGVAIVIGENICEKETMYVLVRGELQYQGVCFRNLTVLCPRG